LDNKYLSAIISIILIGYASMAAPKLPENIARLFENIYFKGMFLFLIAYNAKRDPTVSLIAAICIIVSLQTLHKYDIEKEVRGLLGQSEQEEDSEPAPVQISVEAPIQINNDAQGGALDAVVPLANHANINEVEGLPSVELMTNVKNDDYVGFDESDTSSYETI